jgi:hypothetical protein
VARGQLIAEVRDVGRFSQGASIKHGFGLDPNVFPTGSALHQCVPLRVTYHNGTVGRIRTSRSRTSPYTSDLNAKRRELGHSVYAATFPDLTAV